MKESVRSNVVITGLGIKHAVAADIPSFEKALRLGVSNFKSSLIPELSFPLISASLTPSLLSETMDKMELIPTEKLRFKKILKQSLVATQWTALAALEALTMANITDFSHPKPIAVIAAAQNTAGNYQFDLYHSFEQGAEYLSPSYALHFLDTDVIGIVTAFFNLTQEGFTVGGASASGNVALIKGYQLIADRHANQVLVLGVPADLSPMDLQGLHNIGALGGIDYKDHPELACRPFDEKHNGFIYGQGAGAILLESEEFAHKRQANILGSMHGGCIFLDGNQLPNPNLEAEIHVMTTALEMAGLSTSDVQYINSHGTSSPAGDKLEIEAIETVFRANLDRLVVNSTKSITGHCLWSAGVVEAIATLLQIHGSFVHPTLNLVNPINKNVNLIKEKSCSTNITHALSNSFGFGGVNTSIVISK